jgi:two-component system, NarL family, nitrate/nitrite response regulator NarL
MAPKRQHPPSPADHPQITLGVVSLPAFFRECLISRVSQEMDLRAEDLGTGGSDAVERARRADPDLVLVDLPQAEACLLGEALLQSVPGTRPIAVHRAAEVHELVRLAEAGYIGFVSTDCSFQDLLRELRAAIREEANCPPRLAGALLRALRRRQPDSQGQPDLHLDVLSRREREVAALLERRYSNKEIAAELRIEFGTVKNHVHSVLTKLHVQHRWEIPHLGRRGT